MGCAGCGEGWAIGGGLEEGGVCSGFALGSLPFPSLPFSPRPVLPSVVPRYPAAPGPSGPLPDLPSPEGSQEGLDRLVWDRVSPTEGASGVVRPPLHQSALSGRPAPHGASGDSTAGLRVGGWPSGDTCTVNLTVPVPKTRNLNLSAERRPSPGRPPCAGGYPTLPSPAERARGVQ